VSDEIAIIDEGKIILHGDKQAILTSDDAVLINVEKIGEAVVKGLQQIVGVRIEKDGVHVKRDERFNENMASVFALFHAHGAVVKDAIFGRRTLEKLFLKLTDVRLRDEG
jgi:ABC-type uncharacterized transport system ATPase subunit